MKIPSTAKRKYDFCDNAQEEKREANLAVPTPSTTAAQDPCPALRALAPAADPSPRHTPPSPCTRYESSCCATTTAARPTECAVRIPARVLRLPRKVKNQARLPLGVRREEEGVRRSEEVQGALQRPEAQLLQGLRLHRGAVGRCRRHRRRLRLLPFRFVSSHKTQQRRS